MFLTKKYGISEEDFLNVAIPFKSGQCFLQRGGKCLKDVSDLSQSPLNRVNVSYLSNKVARGIKVNGRNPL